MKSVCIDSIDVALPADSIFTFVAGLAHWPVWFTFVVCAQQHGEPQPRALETHQEIDMCVKLGRRRFNEQFEVVQLVAGAFVCLEGSFSAARRIELRFEQRRASTRVHVRVSYPVFGGAFGWLGDTLFARRSLKGELRRSLLQLKSALEDSEQLPAPVAHGRAGEEALSGSAKQTAVA